jgi:integrase
MLTPSASTEPANRFPFTVDRLEDVQPHESKQVWVYDELVRGLGLCVTPGGARTFYLSGRVEGRFQRFKIGHFPGVSVEQARKTAKRKLGEIADGKNPAEERRQARAAMTFGDLWDRYMAKHAQKHKRTWQEDERQYERHLKPWGNRRLDQITRQDVRALHDRIGIKGEAPVAANRVLALVSKVFNFAVNDGFNGDNPARGIQRFAEQSRERFLDADELPRFLTATMAQDDATFRDLFRMLLFTGQRRENVASMRWDELDMSRKVWTIPPAKFKTGKAVEIPLVPQAVAILTARQQAQALRIAKGSMTPDDPRADQVFPSKRREGGRPYVYEPKGAFARVCAVAGIKGLRLHDLRRTVASWATMQGVPYPVVARMVGHKAQGVTSIYARFDLSAVRDGFEKTVNAMLAAKGGES